MKRRLISCTHPVRRYLRDAEKDNKPELKMWNMIKEDEQNHLKLLCEELVREAKEIN